MMRVIDGQNVARDSVTIMGALPKPDRRRDPPLVSLEPPPDGYVWARGCAAVPDGWEDPIGIISVRAANMGRFVDFLMTVEQARELQAILGRAIERATQYEAKYDQYFETDGDS